MKVCVLVDQFEPNRTMRRIAQRNRSLSVRRVAAQANAEQYALFRSYIDARHGDGGMADMTMLDYSMMIEDSAIETYLSVYRDRPAEPLAAATDAAQSPLRAVALCDRLSDGISMVYSFYEPGPQSLSLGTYMILEHLAYAKSLGLPYLYLGYWIKGSRKMTYKTRFLPQEHMVYTWQFAPGSFLNIVWKNAAINGSQETNGNYFKNINKTMKADDNNNISLKVIYFFDYLNLKKGNKKKAKNEP